METAASDVKFMQRCLELARKGKGKTGLNPMVGCVIVHRGSIIGEGYHKEFGGSHAEVNAISSVKNHNLLIESTLYVNLEPCSHFGKTPPCSLLIKEKSIPRVVIGVKDPNPKVAGQGIASLQKAGIIVKAGILERESIHLNRRFFINVLKKRPYVILKWAESKDGFLDKIRIPDSPIQPTWITNFTARKLVHKWRGEEDAIFAGVNTIIADDPALNLRDWSGNQPVRVCIDRYNRIGSQSKIKDGKQKTFLFSEGSRDSDKTYHEEIQPGFSLADMLIFLFKKNIGSILVEGGAKILNGFIECNMWDEARIFRGNMDFLDGIKSPALPIPSEERIQFRNNLLIISYNRI